MPLSTRYLNSLWGSLIIAELLRNRVDMFFISPGSRSTPLTAAAAIHADIRRQICIDERAAAFAALGYARATGQPAVLICSSGTAGANYYPALIEASQDHLPVIVITADRPPELHESGANQTIRQSALYGDYMRWQFDMPLPDEHIAAGVVLTTIDQLVFRSRYPSPGPVHLNTMFREPLEPQEILPEDPANLWHGKSDPYVAHQLPLILPPISALRQIAGTISGKRGLLVAGRLHSAEETEAVKNLARHLGWSVYPDICSGLRQYRDLPAALPYMDQLLLSEAFQKALQPEVVMQIGDQPLSKRWLQYSDSYSGIRIAIQSHPDRQNPGHKPLQHLSGDISHICAILQEHSTPGNPCIPNAAGLTALVEKVIDLTLNSSGEISEISVARDIGDAIPPQHGLYLAASMPIRDMDMYVGTGNPLRAIASNRGASGIDGTLASACGFAAGLPAPVTLLAGDLATLHDLNSLWLLKRSKYPVILVLINNNGGGIFSFLPIAAQKEIFDPWFSTPTELSFAKAAGLFGLPYYAPESREAFAKAYRLALQRAESAVLEIKTSREQNMRLHQSLQSAIIEQLIRTIT